MRKTSRAIIIDPAADQQTMESILDDSSLSLMTIFMPPPDTLKVIQAASPTTGASTKLQGIFSQNRESMVQTPTTNCSGTAIVLKVPTSVTQEIISVMMSCSAICGDAVPTAISILRDSISTATDADGMTSWSRAALNSLVLAYSAITLFESDQRIYAAASSTVKNISNDFQSKPSDTTLVYTIEQETEAYNLVIDDDFINDNPSVPIADITITDAISETLTNVPNALGVSGENATNVVNADLNQAIENSSITGSETETSVAEAIEGIKRLCSAEMLTAPLKSFLPPGESASFRVVNVKEELGASTDVIPIFTIVLEVLGSDIELSKSVLDQDWTVTPVTLSAKKLHDVDENKNVEMGVYHIAQKLNKSLLKSKINAEDLNTYTYKGCKTGKVYNGIAVQSLATSLSSLWGKMKATSFPSLASTVKAGNILAMGLGAIGHVTQSQTLNNASNALSMFTQGLHSYSQLTSTTSRAITHKPPTPVLLAKFLTSNLPALCEAGAAALLKQAISSTKTRGELNFINNRMNTSFSVTDPSSSTLREVKKLSNLRVRNIVGSKLR